MFSIHMQTRVETATNFQNSASQFGQIDLSPREGIPSAGCLLAKSTLCVLEQNFFEFFRINELPGGNIHIPAIPHPSPLQATPGHCRLDSCCRIITLMHTVEFQPPTRHFQWSLEQS